MDDLVILAERLVTINKELVEIKAKMKAILDGDPPPNPTPPSRHLNGGSEVHAARVKASRATKQRLSAEKDAKVVAYIAAQPEPLTQVAIARALNMPPSSVQLSLGRLVAKGEITRSESGGFVVTPSSSPPAAPA